MIDAALAGFSEDRLRSVVLELQQGVMEEGDTIEESDTSRAIADGLAQLLILAAAGNVDDDMLARALATRFITHIVTVVTLWVADGCASGVMERTDMPRVMPPRLDYVGVPECPASAIEATPRLFPPAISPGATSDAGALFEDLPEALVEEAPGQPPAGGVLNLLGGGDGDGDAAEADSKRAN